MHIADLFVDLKLDTGSFERELHTVLAKAGASSDFKTNVKVKADTKAANSEIGRTARDRTAHVNVKADTKSAEKALDSYTGRLGALASAAVALGPATIPIMGAITAAAGALSASLVTAGSVGGVFGLSVAGQVSQMKKQQQAISTTTTALNKLTPGTKAYTKKLAELNKEQKNFNHQFGPAAKGFQDMTSAWQGFLDKTSKVTNKDISKGLELVAKVLPKLVPLSNAAGRAVGAMLDDLARFEKGREFQGLLDMFEKRGPKALTTFGSIAGHALHGVLRLITAFVPASQGMLGGLDRLTREFDKWASGVGKTKGFRDFIKYARDTLPKVGSLLGNTAKAIGHVVAALAPQGGVTLDLLNKLAIYVGKLKPGQIAAAAGAVGALALATGKFGKLTSLSLLITSLSYAYKHSSAFKELADDAGRLAKALNSLPTAAKLAGVAAIASVVVSGRKSVGGGGGGGVISKIIGGGVQKVFVTNMPRGGLPGGGGGDPIPGGGSSTARTAERDAERAAARGSKFGRFAGGVAEYGSQLIKPGPVIALATLIGGIALIAKMSKATAPVQSNDMRFRPPANSGPAALLGPHPYMTGGLSKLGIILQKSVPNAKNYNDALTKMDAKLRELERTNPGKGLTVLHGILKSTGLSMHDLHILLPKSTADLAGLGRAAAKSANAATAMKGFTDRANAAGISTKQLGKLMNTLPQYVQTQITTPGAIKSRADVIKLGKQFDLTPKQVKTLMVLNHLQAIRDSKKTISQYNLTKPIILTKAQFEATKAKSDARTYRQYLDDQGARIRNWKINVGITEASQRAVNKAQAAAKHNDINDLLGLPLAKATGGFISGPGGPRSDVIPAMLSNGEYVVQASAVDRYGTGLMDMINAGKFAFGGLVRKFASGGPVLTTTPETRAGVFHPEPVANAARQIAHVLGVTISRVLSSSVTRTANAAAIPGGGPLPKGNGIYRPVHGGVISQGLHDQWTGYPAVDIATPVGTPVFAGAAGRVNVSRDMATSYGHWIRIMSRGFSTLYAHLSRRLVGVGATVRGGQLIGYSGSTGNSTGPHLHFGARGKSPLSFLSGGGQVGRGGRGGAGGRVKPLAVATVKDFANGIKIGVDGSALTKRLAPVIKHYLSGKREAVYLKRLNKVAAMADKYRSVTSKLNTATAKRDAIVQQRDDFRTNYASFGPSLSSAMSFRGGVAAGFKNQLAQVRTLAANITKLKALKYPLALINQVVGSGSITDAIQSSNALIAASPADRASITGDFNAITKATTTGGDKLSDSLYGSGLKAANGVIAGLKKQQKAINKVFQAAVENLGKELAKTLGIRLPAKKASGGGSGSGGSGGGSKAGSSGSKGGRNYGTGIKGAINRAAAARGWDSPAQIAALDQIIAHESGWKLNAQNPSSSAYGLFQLTRANWPGGRKPTSLAAQEKAGLNYIKNRYGGPIKAWDFWRAHKWYDGGGWLKQGATMAHNDTGHPEAVLTSRQWSQMERMLALMEKQLASHMQAGTGSPLIGHATIRETVDLERYERQRAFRDRKTRI